MTTTEFKALQEIMETIEQAYTYLYNANDNTNTQIEVADVFCEAAGAVNVALGNKPELQAAHTVLLSYKEVETEQARVQFLTAGAMWIEAVSKVQISDDSSEISLEPLQKENRQIRNIIDEHFYNLMDTIKLQDNEKALYHIKKLFNKLAPNLKKILEDYTAQFQFWGSLNHEIKDYTLLENRAKALTENQSKFVWLYEHLEDYRSKATLHAILNNWYNFDFESLNKVKEHCFKDYFDLDVFTFDENEVIVDLGAFIGDSIIDYVNTYGTRYKKIYCYEITPATVETLKNNLKSLPNIDYRAKGASDKKGVMYIDSNENASANILSKDGKIKVDTVAIDEDITQPVTFIKMDIEGSEQAALRGCEGHIKNEHPKLAISVYHNNEDIWKIAHMIYEMDSTYRFYLRHNGGNLIPTEYILLAI